MVFGIGKAALLAGAAALLAPQASFAQSRNLDGESSDVRVFQGTIDSAPATFEVTVPAGSQMRIDVISTSDLDPMVTVTDTGTGEVIAEDDDGGDELNSRVIVTGGDAGRPIAITVTSYEADFVGEGEEWGGTFDLRLATSAFVPVEERAVTWGARETGTLMGEPHLFTIEGEAGQLVEIALLSADDALDPYLELRDSSGETIVEDDDGGQNLNSLISHVFADDGTYTIAARGFEESNGEYVLRIRDRREIAPQLPLQVIGLEDVADGELSSSYQETTLVPSTIDYQLSEEAKAAILSGDGELTVRMTATGSGDPDFGGNLDPYVEIGFDTPLGFAVADFDDDGAGDQDALLPMDLGSLAQYPALLDMLRIRVQGYGGTAGAYALEITPGMEARADDFGMGEAAAE